MWGQRLWSSQSFLTTWPIQGNERRALVHLEKATYEGNLSYSYRWTPDGQVEVIAGEVVDGDAISYTPLPDNGTEIQVEDRAIPPASAELRLRVSKIIGILSQ